MPCATALQISLYEKESGAHLRQNTIKLKKAFPGMAIDAHL